MAASWSIDNAAASLATASSGQPGRSSGIQPSHASVHSCTATPSRFSSRLNPASHARSSPVNVKKVTASSPAISSGQPLSRANSASDRYRTGITTPHRPGPGTVA